MIITFLGHGDLSEKGCNKQLLSKVLEDSIKKGADAFYCGGYGDFDGACVMCVDELKAVYPDVKIYMIIPYTNALVKLKLQYIKKLGKFDGFVYPEISFDSFKDAIEKRNEWMVDNSDAVIAFVNRGYGSAHTALKYAIKKNKPIVNLAD